MGPLSAREAQAVKLLLAVAVFGVLRPSQAVENTESPVIECPANIVIDTDASADFATVTWRTPNGTDGSGEPLSVHSDQASGSRFAIGLHTVSFNATDSNSTVHNCSFAIKVEDNERPNINCPANMTVRTDTGANHSTIALPRGYSASDNSGRVDVSVDVAGTPHGVGDRVAFYLAPSPHLVRYVATDGSMNRATCQTYITVIDMEPPVIYGCPANINTATEPGEAYGVAVFTEPTARDNSGVVELSGLGRSGDKFLIGRTEVLYIAVDGARNVGTCLLVVSVVDAEIPQLTDCPASFTLSVQQASGRAYADWSPPTATDNSGTVTLSTTFEPGQSLLPGRYSVTYTATDPAGLTVTCHTFFVTVEATGTGCINNPCAHDGTCTPAVVNNGFTCTCTSAWTGATCQEATGCVNGPCANDGACTPAANNGFTCACTSSWSGATCEEDFDECTLPAAQRECSTRGLSCFNRLGEIYTCGCPVGFSKAGNSDICALGRSFRLTLAIVGISGDPSKAVFTTDLDDPNSVAFLTHQSRLQLVIGQVFDGLDGFGNAVVLFFTSGSIIADLLVTFDPSSTVTQSDLDSALQRSISSGGVLMNSEYMVAPGATAVIEEVCADGYCRNEATCAPSSTFYLSSCTCLAGYHGNRCESLIPVTDAPISFGALSTEAVIAIAVGGVISLIMIIILPLCICVVRIRTVDARHRHDHQYSDASVSIVGSRGSRTHETMYDYPLEELDLQNNFSSQPTSHFAVPYVASGRDTRIILNPMRNRGDDYYY